MIIALICLIASLSFNVYMLCQLKHTYDEYNEMVDENNELIDENEELVNRIAYTEKLIGKICRNVRIG